VTGDGVHRIALVSALDPGGDVAVRFLLLRLNVVQTAFEFEFIPLLTRDPFVDGLRGRGVLDRSETKVASDAFADRLERSAVAGAAMFGLPDEERQRVVVLSTARFADRFYVTRTPRLSVLALGDWERTMAPPSLTEFFLSLVISEAITHAVPALRKAGHYGTKGCKLDFSVVLTDARQQVLSSFICASCRSRIPDDLLAQIEAMVDNAWLGEVSDPSSPAAIAAALGHDLFVVKGLRPTLWETVKVTLRQDGVRQLLTVVQTVITTMLVAALLLYLGLK
jgi:hypothetical protein